MMVQSILQQKSYVALFVNCLVHPVKTHYKFYLFFVSIFCPLHSTSQESDSWISALNKAITDYASKRSSFAMLHPYAQVRDPTNRPREKFQRAVSFL